jgi:hypothetical protein
LQLVSLSQQRFSVHLLQEIHIKLHHRAHRKSQSEGAVSRKETESDMFWPDSSFDQNLTDFLKFSEDPDFQVDLEEKFNLRSEIRPKEGDGNVDIGDYNNRHQSKRSFPDETIVTSQSLLGSLNSNAKSEGERFSVSNGSAPAGNGSVHKSETGRKLKKPKLSNGDVPIARASFNLKNIPKSYLNCFIRLEDIAKKMTGRGHNDGKVKTEAKKNFSKTAKGIKKKRASPRQKRSIKDITPPMNKSKTDVTLPMKNCLADIKPPANTTTLTMPSILSSFDALLGLEQPSDFFNNLGNLIKFSLSKK